MTNCVKIFFFKLVHLFVLLYELLIKALKRITLVPSGKWRTTLSKHHRIAT